MKNLSTLLIVALFSLTTISCSKNDDPIAPILPVAPIEADGFRWSENGGTTVLSTSTNSFTTQFNTIYAKNDPIAITYEINLTAGTAGTYTINGTSVALAYVKNSSVFQATSGSVIITANAGGKMSGTFSASGPTIAGITSVSGTFKNINVVP